MKFGTGPEELVEKGLEATGWVDVDGGSGTGVLTESGVKSSGLAEMGEWVGAPELCKPAGLVVLGVPVLGNWVIMFVRPIPAQAMQITNCNARRTVNAMFVHTPR